MADKDSAPKDLKPANPKSAKAKGARVVCINTGDGVYRCHRNIPTGKDQGTGVGEMKTTMFQLLPGVNVVHPATLSAIANNPGFLQRQSTGQIRVLEAGRWEKMADHECAEFCLKSASLLSLAMLAEGEPEGPDCAAFEGDSRPKVLAAIEEALDVATRIQRRNKPGKTALQIARQVGV